MKCTGFIINLKYLYHGPFFILCLSGTALAFTKDNADGRKSISDALLPVKLLFCHICQKAFSDKRSLLSHKKTHEDANHNNYATNTFKKETGAPGSGKEEYVRCTECSKLFRNKQHLSSHHRRSHQKEIQECLKCGKKCKNLTQHKQVVHGGDEIISQAMNESIDATEGYPSVTDDLLSSCKSKQFECQQCLKTFSSKYVLDSHVKRAHGLSDSLQEGRDPQGDPQEGFKCDGCGKRYLNKSGLKRHVKEAHGENRFECTECGQFFPVKHSLDRHFANVHHPVRHSCPICKDIHVIHLKAHLTGPSHQMSSSQAQNLVDEAIGKFAARTHLPLDDVIRRRVTKDKII